MKKQLITLASEWIIPFLFLFLFAYTSYAKIIDHEAFSKALSDSVLISDYADFVAWLIPIIEILIAITFIIPKMQPIGLIASLGLISIFTVYLIYMLMTASTLPCHCGGVISNLTWRQHIWLNMTFIVMAAFALRFKNNSHNQFTV